MLHTKLKYLLLIAFLLGGELAHSCLNEYRTLLDGKVEMRDAHDAAPSGRFNQADKSFLLKELRAADSIYKATGKLEDYSDYGTMLVYNGEYLKAKAIFIDIERQKPGLYATAANLGTTYELLGQNDSAYYWINKAMKINPQSHEGSEWIHVKILEAKMQAKGDASYFAKHNLLSLDFGDTEIPQNKQGIDLDRLRKQLYHQLNERMSFVKPQDPIVAQLLFDLGNVSAITMDVKSGLQVYEVAQAYGYSSDVLTKRKKHFISLQRKADFRNGTIGWAKKNPQTALFAVLALGIVSATGLYLLIKRYQKRKRTKVDAEKGSA